MRKTWKGEILRWTVVLVLTCGTAFSQTLALKASIGVCACWDALALNIYDLFGMKVGTFGIIMNILCVLGQFLIQRKNFQVHKVLQIPYVVVFGLLVNFFNYDVLTFEVNSYLVRVLLVVAAYLGLALFLGPLLLLNLVAMPSEALCSIISGEYEIDYAKVRVALDIGVMVLSVLLSAGAGVSLKVREGTVIGMLMLGPLEKVSMKIFRPAIGRLRAL